MGDMTIIVHDHVTPVTWFKTHTNLSPIRIFPRLNPALIAV